MSPEMCCLLAKLGPLSAGESFRDKKMTFGGWNERTWAHYCSNVPGWKRRKRFLMLPRIYKQELSILICDSLNSDELFKGMAKPRLLWGGCRKDNDDNDRKALQQDPIVFPCFAKVCALVRVSQCVTWDSAGVQDMLMEHRGACLQAQHQQVFWNRPQKGCPTLVWLSSGCSGLRLAHRQGRTASQSQGPGDDAI